MNIEEMIADAVRRVENQIQSAKNALVQVQQSADKTVKFLDLCAKAKIDKVAIGVAHESVPASMGWRWGASGNVFSIDTRTADGWPAIWGVCKEMGYSSCGNGNQYQCGEDLVDGVYHLSKGKWRKVR